MFGSRSGCLVQNERLLRRIPMFPRPPTSSRRTYDSCDPLATAMPVVKGIPRSLDASSRRPSLENAGPGCHRWFDYCSPHGVGSLMTRKDLSRWNLRSLTMFLFFNFCSLLQTPSSLGPNRLLDFEGYRAHPGGLPLPCGLTFWARSCRPHPARDRKQTDLRSCAEGF